MTDYSQEATYFKLTRPSLERAADRLLRVRVNRVGGYGRCHRVQGRGGAYIVTLATARGMELGHCSCPAKVICRRQAAAVLFETGIEAARKAVQS